MGIAYQNDALTEANNFLKGARNGCNFRTTAGIPVLPFQLAMADQND